MEFKHKSVLFDEAIAALELNESKIIADGTAGGGGHSREIAKTAKKTYCNRSGSRCNSCT